MDKKTMEELMAKRVGQATDRLVVKSVDLLKSSIADGSDVATNIQTSEALKSQSTEAPYIMTGKEVSIQEAMNTSTETGKKRGRPKSTAEDLVHFSTWLPEELVWAIRGKAVALRKKDYEVVTEAIRSFLEKL